MDQTRPARGGSGAPLGGPWLTRRPPPAAPTSEPRPGDRLVRGSPGGVWARDIPLYRRAVRGQRHGDTPTLCVFKPHRGRRAGWATWPSRRSRSRPRSRSCSSSRSTSTRRPPPQPTSDHGGDATEPTPHNSLPQSATDPRHLPTDEQRLAGFSADTPDGTPCDERWEWRSSR
jgi:hypothetical protein